MIKRLKGIEVSEPKKCFQDTINYFESVKRSAQNVREPIPNTTFLKWHYGLINCNTLTTAIPEYRDYKKLVPAVDSALETLVTFNKGEEISEEKKRELEQLLGKLAEHYGNLADSPIRL